MKSPGIDINFNGNPVFARGEYIIREDERPSADSRSMNGGYLLGGFNVTSDLEAIARYSYVDPNASTDDDHVTGLTLGANYFFIENTRLSVNYEFRKDHLNPDIGNLITVQMQLTL